MAAPEIPTTGLDFVDPDELTGADDDAWQGVYTAIWAERAEADVNESDEGNSDVIDAIWPNTYLLVCSAQPGELKSGGIGRTFFWEKEGPLFNIQSYRDETRKSNVIRAMKTSLSDLTNTRAGQLITTQYA